MLECYPGMATQQHKTKHYRRRGWVCPLGNPGGSPSQLVEWYWLDCSMNGHSGMSMFARTGLHLQMY